MTTKFEYHESNKSCEATVEFKFSVSNKVLPKEDYDEIVKAAQVIKKIVLKHKEK